MLTCPMAGKLVVNNSEVACFLCFPCFPVFFRVYLWLLTGLGDGHSFIVSSFPSCSNLPDGLSGLV
ncbi:MAG: hypothetical protein APR63_01815 [Desulfuromonas sp. SDB]|nr:MAG: hypothetical protein APR63_01815 [Desulfuromonas sp. SDB]